MLPSVTVIIPTFNAEKGIEKCIRSVLSQNYPHDLVSIVIADNCSEDNTVKVAGEVSEDVIIARECTHLASPYSARNRGIEISQSEVIVLLDSDCTPVDGWLSNGVKSLQSHPADIIGGNVLFTFSDKPTVAEMYDAIMNIKMKESIEKHRMAKTANLFIRREVFTDIGLFPEGWRSGGDVFWTGKAASGGKKLTFSSDAAVFKPARKFSGLVKKQWRVAKAQSKVWIKNKHYPALLINLVKIAIPPATIKRNITEGGHPFIHNFAFRIFLLSLIIRPVMIAGNLFGILQHIGKIKP